MPKPMFVWSGSAWVSVAAEVESLATYATQSYADNQPGMKLVVPTSVTVGSGSGSVSTQGAVTFSGASSVSLNGCFTSAYDNYKIVFTKAYSSTAGAVRTRLRASGTDNTTASSYVRRGFGSDVPSGLYNQTEATTSWYCFNATTSSTSYSFQTMEIYNPFLATETQMTSTQLERNGDTGSMQIAYHNQTTSYDGITFFSTSSYNLTGTIRVYGLKNG